MDQDIEIVEITRNGRVMFEGEGSAQEALTLAGVPVPTGEPTGNPYCMRCGDERGGPWGHETNECAWGRSPSTEGLGDF